MGLTTKDAIHFELARRRNVEMIQTGMAFLQSGFGS